jgi:hypothetical protein
MYGLHSKTFILKEKVKLPFADIAHNAVYFMSDVRCQMSDVKCLGAACN